jgi:hypothetical protein
LGNFNTLKYMSKPKWYKIRVTPIESNRSPYEFKIETSNLKETMDRYSRDKEGNVTKLWEKIK